MRRAGDRRRVEALFLKPQEPFRQPVELGAGLLHHLPLLRQLIGKLLDGLGLMGHGFLELGDAGVFIGHGLSPKVFLSPSSIISAEANRLWTLRGEIGKSVRRCEFRLTPPDFG